MGRYTSPVRPHSLVAVLTLKRHPMKALLRFACLLSAIIAANWASPAAEAATVDPTAAKGKHAVYVFNQTKLEKARAAVPAPEPKRLAALELWRKCDNDAMAYLESLGFVVARANEATPPEVAAKGKWYSGQTLTRA